MPAQTNPKDYYGTLGLIKGATPEDIKAAYKSLALQWHPDRHTTSKEDAARKFIEINEAYKFLIDQGRRESYGQIPLTTEKSRGRHGPRSTTTGTYSTKTEKPQQPSKPEQSSAGGGLKVPSMSAFPSTKSKSDPGLRDAIKDEGLKVPHNLPHHTTSEAGLHEYQKNQNVYEDSNIPTFSFHHPSGRSTSEGRAPPATEVPLSDTKNRAKSSGGKIEADLRDFIRRMSGGTQKVHQEPPSFSSQKATVYDDDEEQVPLKDTGTELHTTTYPSTDIPAEWIFPLPLTLEELYEGSSHRYRITRHLLSGKKKDVMVDVDIGPGWKKGTKIRFTGAGNERRNNTPQDVVFVVEELPHHSFVREGSTLITHVPISLREALAVGGRTVHLVGIDSRPISFEVPFDIIRPGDEYVLRGAGMPIRKHGRIVGRGDLVVRWDIQFPQKLTKEQKQELERIL